MFFMMGITEGRKKLNFQQTVVCSQCGRYGRYMVYMTYTVLSLFFIPCLKWNKQYYVENSCCHTTYRLNPEVGKRIERGEQPEIHPQDLERMNGYQQGRWKHCVNCGYTTQEDFEYCPKCGNRF